jgi:glycosyltransferase involved in cell wall biosynthesis
MKILLLGEHSGVHAELKRGLIELGHEVLLVSNGGSWRDIEADINLINGGKSFINKVERRFRPILLIPKLSNFDVVHLIHPNIFNPFLGMDKIVMRAVLRRNRKVFMSLSGCNLAFYKFENSSSGFPMLCASCKKYDLKSEVCMYQTTREAKWENKVISKVAGVIPWAYEYGEAFKQFNNIPKLMETMPLPLSVKTIPHNSNRPGKKVVFFHGLIREGFKGTDLIVNAMENMKKKYPNDIDIIVNGRLTLKEYQELLNGVNVVIDQLYTFSYGMNALYSMAQCKIVLAGIDHKIMESMGFIGCPIINIKPEVKSIETAMADVMENKENIEELGARSRQFVEKYHDSKIVAEKFINLWASV